MKLPTRLTYSLRMMVEISKRSSEDEPVCLSEVSRVTGISRNYLEQLTMHLKSHSLLRGVSGKKGGYRLAKPANDIKILDIVKATIGPIYLTKCIDSPESCTRSAHCECRNFWLLINLQMKTVMENYSLADLSNGEKLDSINKRIEWVQLAQPIFSESSHVEISTPSAPQHNGAGKGSNGILNNSLSFPELPLRTPLDREPTQGTHGTTLISCHEEVEKEDYLEVLKWLEEELRLRVGSKNVSIPVDRKNARLVYTTHVREIKYMPFTLLAAAEIFHVAKEDWTMITKGWDSSELFKGVLGKGSWNGLKTDLFSAIQKLNGKKIVLSECDHTVWPSKWATPQPSYLEMKLPVESFIHTMFRYVKTGRIRLDPSKNDEPVTYHDPCILGRHYGITEEPRYILMKAVSEFREMYPNRTENWCCRGGGGGITEYNFRKTEISKIKADQILRTGAKIVATSCANCIDGLNELVGEFNLDLKIKSVGELVAQALIYQ